MIGKLKMSVQALLVLFVFHLQACLVVRKSDIQYHGLQENTNPFKKREKKFHFRDKVCLVGEVAAPVDERQVFRLTALLQKRLESVFGVR